MVDSFEYKTTTSLIVQGGTNQPEGPNKPEIPEQPGEGTVELSSLEIKGTKVAGNTLSANVKDSNGNDVNSGLAYKWYRVDRVGAVSETLVSANSMIMEHGIT